MKSAFVFAAASFLFSTLLISASGLADDWPDWMGENRDSVWHETGILDKFPVNGPKVLWRQPIGIGYTGPSVSDGNIYVMDWELDESRKKEMDQARKEARQEQNENGEKQPQPLGMPGIPGIERVVCLSTKDGAVVWEHRYETVYQISYPNGPRTTPIIDGDLVYTLGAMGRLICFKKKNGDVVWEKELTKEYDTKHPIWGFSAHPLIHNNTLFCTVGGDGSAIVAFDKKSGKEIWKSTTCEDIGYVPLVLFGSDSNQQLIMWHGDGLNSVNPSNGEANWDLKFPEFKAQPQSTCIAMPRIVGNRLFLSSFYDGSMLIELDENDASKFKEIYRSTKENLRNNEHLNSLLMTPHIKDGHVFGVASDSRGNGMLMCAELETGKKVWTETTSLGKGGLSFATLFIVSNGDRCFLSNDQGELIIAKLGVDGYEESDRFKLLKPTHAARGRHVVWSHPAFANGCIFARNDEEIVCVDLRKLEQEKGSGP